MALAALSGVHPVDWTALDRERLKRCVSSLWSLALPAYPAICSWPISRLGVGSLSSSGLVARACSVVQQFVDAVLERTLRCLEPSAF